MTAEQGEACVAGWPWPESLDALIAAPQHHALLLETEPVRVLETRTPPGDRVPLHTHRWPSVLYVVSWSDFLRCDEDGKLVVDSRVASNSPPTVIWSPPLPPHSLENVGSTEIRVISVELKQLAA
jgi:hypothetical protein